MQERTEDMIVYQCEDNIENIFTAIYNAYEEQRDHKDTRIALHQELLLFAQYVPVETDPVKAMKVIRTIKRRFGEEDYHAVCSALSSNDSEKGHAVYQVIVKGIEQDLRQGQLLQNLADDDCNRVFRLARGTTRECQHLMGFVRFQEISGLGKDSVLYSVIGPKNDVLPFLMPHFADRLPKENFVIYDEKRGVFGVHPAGQQWYLLRGMTAREDQLVTEEEAYTQQLFQQFCQSIAIKERENRDLQRNMLPLRFRKYMVEF